jgi:riboflavin synthase
MFTGLIETTGTVLALDFHEDAAPRLTIAAPSLAGRWRQGDSIAVNGVCLTAIEVESTRGKHPGRFCADLADETVRRTTLTRLKPGALVNLELPTPAGSPLGGHVVQGHVDGTGKIVALMPLQNDLERTDWRLTIDAPAARAGSIVPQGSITVDGISLTVAKLDPPQPDASVRLEIAVIPHTYRATHLHSLLSGAEVNLETDVLARYAARRADFATQIATPPAPMQETQVADSGGEPSTDSGGITIAALIANGY